MAELTVLLVGAGGREHALAWRLSLSPRVRTVFVAPGNAGTASSSSKIINVDLVPQIRDDWKNFVDFALNNHVNLVVPGPEQPLVDGIELAFRKVGIPVFGPTPTAALMEGSKSAAKAFMARHNLPTASYRSFTSSQLSEAEAYVREQFAKGEEKLVIKASGLAAGKGVVIAESEDEAMEAVRAMLVAGVFGDAGHEIILESHLTGPELSLLAFSDGYTVLPLPPAQDHKRIGENDTGPNTGGMGAYAPAPETVASREVVKEMERIVERCVAGMRRDGFPFTGLLFTGFILTSSGPQILEFNVRFGDPETEALMLLLGPQTDLAEIMLACVDHRLDAVSLSINPGFAVSVILASKGYPGSYEKGKVITIESDKIPKDVQIFHAGTSVSPSNPQEVVTNGGRVLVVAAYAHTLEGALKLAYDAVKCVSFEGMVYRTDIGYRALQPTATLQPLTYASAGVSVAHGNDLVSLIKPLIKSTARPGSDASIGGFGGVFDLAAAGYSLPSSSSSSSSSNEYDPPLLVSGTDGVGTKLRIATELNAHSTVGIDLVAMSVNDLLVQGAEPLFFLDYFACGKLNVATAAEVVKGVVEGCRDAGCALVGGETAEMPGMYAGDDYDIAGFAVGAVLRSQLLPKIDLIKPGDVLLGIPSSGLHSNGFSLVRKVVSLSGLSYTSPCPFDFPFPTTYTPEQKTLGAALLTPTKIYTSPVLQLLRNSNPALSKAIKALAHITGGGFVENIPRVFPRGVGCAIRCGSYPLMDVFRWIMRVGHVRPEEMARTFNMGVGMVVVVDAGAVGEFKTYIEKGELWRIGEIVEGEGVRLLDIEAWAA